MSTNVLRDSLRQFAADSNSVNQLSLTALAHKLLNLPRLPTQQQLDRWLRGLDFTPGELAPFLSFRAGTYVRHRVCRGELAEMLVLCWRPGQRTAIHDHNGSLGAIRVCEGELEEETFSFAPEGVVHPQTKSRRVRGEITGTDVPDVHRLGNSEGGGRDLVTVHIYAPPLKVIRTYRVGSAEVGTHVPADPVVVPLPTLSAR
ncbi:MAG: cysteine dioxygenase [Pyrinomonadaceae bacterium]